MQKKFIFYVFFCNFAPKNVLYTLEMLSSATYSALYDWYDTHHRVLPWRETTDPYHIWLSEIILQQTRVNQGLAYYLRFIERFPDVETLAAASEDEVLLYWQGLGYYSRARNLHKAAQHIVASRLFESSGSRYVQHSTPCLSRGEEMERDIYDALRQLPGVGDYTAGAIASFAYNLPYPAMDGNVYRVLARLFDCDEPFDTVRGKKTFHQLIIDILDKDHPRLFNSSMMELGALVCTPQSPDCTHCPLQINCAGYAHHTVELLPVRKPRPMLKDRYFVFTIYIDAHCQTLLHQRQGKDIWQHLWEFPLRETERPEGDYPITHILSHQRLHARFETCHVEQLPDIADTVVVAFDDLDNYAFPRLIDRYLANQYNSINS